MNHNLVFVVVTVVSPLIQPWYSEFAPFICQLIYPFLIDPVSIMF